MMQSRRCQRTLILYLLLLSVFAPLIFVSHRLQVLTTVRRKEFIEDFSSVTYRTDSLKLNAIEQVHSEGLEEPRQVVYKDNDFVSTLSYGSKKNNDFEESRTAGYRSKLLGRNGFDRDKREDQEVQQKEPSYMDEEKIEFNETLRHKQSKSVESQRATNENIKAVKNESNKKAAKIHQTSPSRARQVTNKKVREINDQIIRARAYVSFAPPNSNTHLVRELKLRIKEMERAVGEAIMDSDLPRSVLQRMRPMEAALSKASRVFPDCSAMVARLRAMNYNAEEQFRSQRNQVTFLVNLAARTTPKGLHCLSMRLTEEYFALQPEERKLLKETKIDDPALYHFAVFSDSVLACAVVVNSTVSSAKDPKKLVFHVVTNPLNFPAISMWFLLNPPGKAAIHIQSIDEFKWMSIYNTFKKPNSSNPIYSSELNYLRFYLPDIFPALNKIVLFDHDVVVQQDLTGLWKANMKGKVIGAVGTCREGETSFQRIDKFINFSDPYIAKRFDVNACPWAFGMNIFDLQEWRRHNMTAVYQKYLQMGLERPLWYAGSLPLGWLTFYNKTKLLDRRWQILGLGSDSGIDQNEVEQAAVIHYDGVRKPWLDIAIGRYKGYWTKFVNYDLPFIQQCNL